MNLTDKIFLFSFDLIELNSFYNYLIYCIFLILEFIFIAYYPIYQMYTDYEVHELIDTHKISNETGTPIYKKFITYKYNKSFAGENKDNYVANIIKYLNIDYYLDNMPF